MVPLFNVEEEMSPEKNSIATVFTFDAMQRPAKFFLHAGIADYFRQGGQRYQNFVSQPMKWIKSTVSL